MKKAIVRKARCKQVLVILDNKLETVQLLREETFPPVGDLEDEQLTYAVVKYRKLLVHVPINCVVFMPNGAPTDRTTRALLWSDTKLA